MIADKVFINGFVYTVDKNLPVAEAVAVKDNIIIFVGSNSECLAYKNDKTEVIDLTDKMLLPGFIDSHCHPDQGGVAYTTHCSLFGINSTKELLSVLKKWSDSHPDDEWILGTGWAFEALPNDNYAKILDEIIRDRPVYLISGDWHNAWVNSKALEVCGIDSNSSNPQGGAIVKDKITHQPTGLLEESAIFLPDAFMPETNDIDGLKSLQAAMKQANKNGITTLLDAWGNDPRKDEHYKFMDQQGLMTTRTLQALVVMNDWDEDLDKLCQRKVEPSESSYQATHAKFMLDGVCETCTASLKKHYLTEGKDSKGTLYYKNNQLETWIPKIEAQGFQIHSHTIGDNAVDVVLSALELSRTVNGQENNRPYFAHCYLIDEEDYPRLKAANATVSFTMLWRQKEFGFKELIEPNFSKEDIYNMMPMNKCNEYGLNVIGNSDWPVSQFNPLASMEVALTGGSIPLFENGERDINQEILSGERVKLDILIEAYTINPARALKMEDSIGSITKGKKADLAVLDRNLFECSNDSVYNASVFMTILDGKVVYQC